MRFLVIGMAALVAACGGRAAAPPKTAQPKEPLPAPQAAPSPEPDQTPTEPVEARIPPPSPECATWVVDVDAAPCSDGATARARLADALEAPDGAAQNRALASLEACTAFEPGVVRALRADLAPRGCADVLIAPAPDKGLRRDVRDTLTGLGIAAQLSRLVRVPPALEAPYDRERFMEFFRSALVPWISEQARAIFELSGSGARLQGYGQGVVAIEAGLADMRFVEVARGLELPDDMKSDPELRDVYYGALEEALEPRKTRGRDAALVGLRRFADLGVIEDARIAEARKLLSALYGGRRIDALDGLIVPTVDVPEPHTVHARIAAAVPTFYVGYLVPDATFTSPEDLGALSAQGLPAAVRQRLIGGSLSAVTTKVLARALLRLGQTYWRAEDFGAARQVLAPLVSGRKRDPEAELMARLAEVLSRGPRDAAQMMLEGPRYPAGVGSVGALDALARGRGALAGAAAFDAAYLMRLVPPLEADPAYFDDVAKRFRQAAALLSGDDRARAEELSRAASDTAKAVREGARQHP